MRRKAEIRIAQGLLIPVVAATLCSCNRVAKEEQARYPTSRPTVAAMAGRYVVVGDAGTLARHGAKGQLDLRPSGFFIMRDMPGCVWPGELLAYDRTWSGHGAWSILGPSPAAGGMPPYSLNLSIQKLNGTPMHLGNSLGYPLRRASPGAPGEHEIRFPVGDPDSGDRVILQRIGDVPEAESAEE